MDKSSAAPDQATRDERVRGLVSTYFDFVWRSLRRLGVPEADVDDSAQQVFLTATQKLAALPVQKEKSFLFGTCLRVASHARRSQQRSREVHDDQLGERQDTAPDPGAQLEQRQARALADTLLAQMPLDLRAVFLLFELEEMSTPQIAEMLAIPVGTVASRLRRAREDFHERIKRLQASSPLRQGSR